MLPNEIEEKLLPGFLFAEFGDVRCVMASVPGVEEKQPVHGARPVFRVDKHAAELIRGERAPKSNPTVMKRIEKSEGNFDRRGFRVGELRPKILLVGFDGWLFFC